MLEKVTKNQEFIPYAEDQNAFIDAALDYKNRQNNMRPGAGNAPRQGLVWIKNGESKDLSPFVAVTLPSLAMKIEADGKPLIGGAEPIFNGKLPTKDDKEDTPFAVLVDPLPKGKIARAAVSGATLAKVNIGNKDHKFSVVAESAGSTGASLKSAKTGGARILWKAGESGEQWCILLLGAGSGDGDGYKYDGPFAVTLKDEKLQVSGGWMNRNGDFLEVKAKSGIELAEGILCVCSSLDGETGKWSEPEFKFTEPATDAYPIAEIKKDEDKKEDGAEKAADNPVDGDGEKEEKKPIYKIRQFHVTVAILMVTMKCPLAEF